VGVTHEAILTAGAPLDQAIEENASTLRARRAVEQAATEWETNVDNATARIRAIAWPAVTTSEWDRYLPDLPYQPPCP
jgi:hypothetical protein